MVCFSSFIKITNSNATQRYRAQTCKLLHAADVSIYGTIQKERDPLRKSLTLLAAAFAAGTSYRLPLVVHRKEGVMQQFFISLWQNDIVRLALQTALKLLMAALFGGIIGYEREHSHRPAGFRTHILVAVGAALVMATNDFLFVLYEGRASVDPARLGAQVISGIGFLGAGTILREGFSVKGLTTAASLWAVSCIGLAAGSGFYVGALIATIVIYITLNLLKRFVIRGSTGKTLYIEVADITSLAPEIGSVIKKCGANLHSLEILYADEEKRSRDGGTVVLKALIFVRHEQMQEVILEAIRDMDGVLDLYVD